MQAVLLEPMAAQILAMEAVEVLAALEALAATLRQQLEETAAQVEPALLQVRLSLERAAVAEVYPTDLEAQVPVVLAAAVTEVKLASLEVLRRLILAQEAEVLRVAAAVVETAQQAL
jgi:hypothetical protein